ncbi:metallophosphoesterase family protein [Candidatus Palauibacter sp.]|uniref:metallophosphoesterase family protein n=1 Tax=Candidatus Palauibacter sp. TaxID=3101350 RepID=UPI003B59185E
MKIVHFADLHLDSPFAWCEATGDVARRRREALRETLIAVVRLTRESGADALFCGGDLYEHDRVTLDTGEFLRQQFASLDPVPVYIAPGNHDWHGPGSLYATEWSHNVHIFRDATLQPTHLAPGITLWGGAHCAPANTDNFLGGGFRVEGPGVHVALFHGAEQSWLAAQGEGKAPHAPFETAEIQAAGFHHAFLGHYHRPADGEHHTYPGNPDPLQFGEDGMRGPVVATVAADGTLERERHVVAVTQVHELALNVTGFTSRQQIRDALREEAEGLAGLARLTVSGDLEPSLDLQEDTIREQLLETFEAVRIRKSGLHLAYDLEEIGEEPTVRGQFVRDVLGAELPEDERRRVLRMGLRALDGRDDLEVL